jgi:aldehyde dehydrogenase (NAD+)
MDSNNVEQLLNAQRAFFATGVTKELAFRKQQLTQLKQAIITHEQQIIDALHADLGKPAFQSYSTELFFCLQEIKYVISNLECWACPARVATPWYLFPAKSSIVQEPLGSVLILAPWNYPFHLIIMPLIGALAAGNCAVLKPSELAPHTAAMIARLMHATFDPSYVAVVQGGSTVAHALTQQPFDHIFFTGSPAVGKLVMQAAASNLTSLTLELGGKNPCIVDRNVSLEVAAKRIVQGKFANAGQSCVAPDYVLVHVDDKDALVRCMQDALVQMYGINAAQSPDYPRIVNAAHYERLVALMGTAPILYGGAHDRTALFIAPTILAVDNDKHLLMHDEIFGPLLPLITYTQLDEVLAAFKHRPKPLAVYIFSKRTTVVQQVINNTASGSVAINTTALQIANPHLPFGGVGMSGFGRYHGKASFLTFSNAKSVLATSLSLDMPWWYPPYKRRLLVWITNYLRWLVR